MKTWIKAWLCLCLLASCADTSTTGAPVDVPPSDTASDTALVLDTIGDDVHLSVDAAPAELPPTVCAGDPLAYDVPMSTDMAALQQRFDTNAQLLRILVILSPG